jgi:hypothetical protein
MRSLADVFRWAALPAALRTLPAVEREIFLNAATVLLDLDPRTKRRSRQARSAILRGDFESQEEQCEAVRRLELAFINVGKDAKAEKWDADWDEIKKLPEGELRRRGRRIFAAGIIGIVLENRCGELTFAQLMNLLFLLQRDVNFENDSERGWSAAEQKNGPNRPARLAELNRLADAASALRLRKPNLTQSARAGALSKDFFDDKLSSKALILRAKRAGIEI